MTFKPAYWHFVYISALILLGFQYYSKATLLERTCESLGGINQQLQDDAEIISASAESMKYEIRKKADINPNKYRSYCLRSEVADTIIKNTLLYLKGCENHLKATSSFDKNKIQELKQYLSNAKNALTNVDDSRDKEYIFKKSHLKSYLENEGYWTRLTKLPNEAILTELSKMENLVLNDEIFFLNYTLDMVSRVDITFDRFRVAIVPQKIPLIEGEQFESRIYLSSYSSIKLGEGATISVNGAEIPITYGSAYYKSSPQSIGKKTIQAVISLRNPATGEVTATRSEFDYEVFPKCSRDCQQ